ncbi:acyl-CoA synthetase [Ilumatobacter sp.]|uniref:acyl-CoA synthetase n=1 Tax=Ilumatobacter sp. TaxID=1967498 RepID=UPI003AF61A62
MHGDHPDAVVVDGEACSWEQLTRAADAVGVAVAGAPALAVSGTSTLATVTAVVAGLRTGVPVVPVPADAGPMEREHILRDSGAAVVVGDPAWPESDLPRVPLPVASDLTATSGRGEPDGTATALIMYTSGTTGLPKGVIIPRRAIAAGLDGLADAWSWTPGDTLVHGLPLFHVHGLILGVLGALRVGSKLHHTGRPTPERYARAGGSLYFGVPTVWSRVASEPDHAKRLASARLLVSGSAALPVPVFEQLRALAGQVPVERYGMTETLITLSTRADGERRPGHVGVPIAGVETRLRDELGEPVAHDGVTIGGLQVRGSTLFDGYLHLPGTTAEAMTDDGWFVTGDAVTIGPDGFHRIVGRASIDIIKSGGYKVGAGEVETALLSHPSVDEVAVIGVPDDDLGERIVAFVVGDDPDELTLIDHVADQLSVHKRPREVRRVAALPRNAMGKVQKQQLRD